MQEPRGPAGRTRENSHHVNHIGRAANPPPPNLRCPSYIFCPCSSTRSSSSNNSSKESGKRRRRRRRLTMTAPGKQLGWGSLLSQAVAGVESRLDTILAEGDAGQAPRRTTAAPNDGAKTVTRSSPGMSLC